jgi:tetratricopeptide (TPR) repeat protein
MPDSLLIGWDGADWQQIHPLLDAGAMPNLARVVESGVMGELAAMTPPCSSLLWTSVATGMFADRHGVLDAVEADPVTGGVRPVTRSSLRARQVWDILAGEGVASRVLGWPATHPAVGPATCASDGFVHGISRSIFPFELESAVTPLRFLPQEWTGDELALFVPRWREVNQDRDKGLARLAVLLAEAVSTHAAATTLMETDASGFTAVWFGAVARAAATFAADDPLYGEVVNGVYRFLDLLLGRLVELAGPEAVVLVVSERGVFCAAGPAIEADDLAFGAGLLDLAPTVLALFGFAPAEGMPGRAIAEVCATAPARRVSEAAASAGIREEEVDAAELEALGYVDAIGAAQQAEADAARQRRDFNLARVLSAQGRYTEAIPVLERLTAGGADARLYLAHAYYQTGRLAECGTLCEALIAEAPDSSAGPMARAYLAIAEGDYAGAREQLESARDGYGMRAAIDSSIGWAYLHLRSWAEAEKAFRSAIDRAPGLAQAHEGLARALMGTGQHEEAASAALDAIRLRYDFAPPHEVLAEALQALGRKQAAAEAMANSERLRRRTPAA